MPLWLQPFCRPCLNLPTLSIVEPYKGLTHATFQPWITHAHLTNWALVFKRFHINVLIGFPRDMFNVSNQLCRAIALLGLLVLAGNVQHGTCKPLGQSGPVGIRAYVWCASRIRRTDQASKYQYLLALNRIPTTVFQST